MKPVRWTRHARENLVDRDIPLNQAVQTLASPDRIMTGREPRRIFQRRYFDRALRQEVLLRIVVEETELEQVVVTLYKTTKLTKYE